MVEFLIGLVLGAILCAAYLYRAMAKLQRRYTLLYYDYETVCQAYDDLNNYYEEEMRDVC